MTPLHTLVWTGLLLLPGQEEKPFTGPPQRIRDRTFDMEHLRLELSFDWKEEEVRGKASCRLAPFDDGLRYIDLDAVGIEVLEVRGPEGPLGFRTLPETLRIDMGRGCPAGKPVSFEIRYRARRPASGLHFIAPDGGTPELPLQIWSQGETEHNRHWFPCYDHPNDRFTWEVIARVPERFFVLSNGDLIEDRVEGEDRVYHYRLGKPHVSYLLSIVVGEYVPYRLEWDGISVVSYVYKGMEPLAPVCFGETARALAFLSERTGFRYPWDSYRQIIVADFRVSGMENVTATTLTDRTIHGPGEEPDEDSTGLVVHELAHQWFGDIITCNDWGDIWLNEGFATYFEAVWREQARGRDDAAYRRFAGAERYFKEDRERYRRPLSTRRYERSWDLFDAHSYPKGARVLHALRFVLGETLFWKGIRKYMARHAFDVVETADFRRAMEEATGRALRWFFDEWVHKGGHPEFQVRKAWDAKAKTLTLTVRQVQKVDEVTPVFETPVLLEFTVGSKRILRRISVAKPEETFTFELAAEPEMVRFDKNDWILDVTAFEKAKEEWVYQLRNDDDITGRILAGRALRAFSSDGSARAALLDRARRDPFWAVRKEHALTLKDFGGTEVRDGLAGMLSDSDSRVRRGAIEALEAFPHAETAAALRRVISADPSAHAIADAVRTLAKVDRSGAFEDLIKALERDSWHDVIRVGAMDGIGEIDDPGGVALAREWAGRDRSAWVRPSAFQALARLGRRHQRNGDDALEVLHGHLREPRDSIRRSLIEAIGDLGDERSLPVLRDEKARERNPRALRLLDEAIEKIRRGSDVRKLSEEVGRLRQAAEGLERRVEAVEHERR